MPEFDYDLFVIGAGSGGVRAARMSAGFGAKVAIAEDRYLGGTCVNVGCVPKKLFVYASHFSEDFAIARSFGWNIENTKFNWGSLIKNKDAEIKRLNGVYQGILDSADVTTITGRATLHDAHTIRVDEKTFTAERILIATGGWPNIPDLPGTEHAITSNEAFHLDELPEQIVIVGGGYIAVEFACIFHAMGVRTTLLYRGPLFLRGFDQDLRTILADEMSKKGIKLLFDTNVRGISKIDSGLKVQLTTDQHLITDTVMLATGRKPNTTGIGLEQVGVKLNGKGAVIVDDHYQSSVPSIYAIGDVIDRIQLTPVALAEGMVLARSLFSNQSIKVNYRDIPTCVFSQPNLGTVGLTEEEAREHYNEIAVYKSRFKPMKLSLSDSNEKIFMKLIVDKASDRVVGIHMVGPDAGEIMQGMAIAMKAGATKSTFDATIGIHPTAAEEFVSMRC